MSKVVVRDKNAGISVVTMGKNPDAKIGMNLRRGTPEDKIGRRLEVVNSRGEITYFTVVRVRGEDQVEVVLDLDTAKNKGRLHVYTITAKNGIITEPAQLDKTN